MASTRLIMYLSYSVPLPLFRETTGPRLRDHACWPPLAHSFAKAPWMPAIYSSGRHFIDCCMFVIEIPPAPAPPPPRRRDLTRVRSLPALPPTRLPPCVDGIPKSILAYYDRGRGRQSCLRQPTEIRRPRHRNNALRHLQSEWLCYAVREGAESHLRSR